MKPHDHDQRGSSGNKAQAPAEKTSSDADGIGPEHGVAQRLGNQGLQRLLDARPSISGRSHPMLQPKLAVSPPDDVYEQEADRVANQVLTGRVPLALDTQVPVIQRFTEGPSRGAGEIAPDGVNSVLASPGSQLAEHLRNDMEFRFGRNFSHVRIHTNDAAGRSAAQVHARAYTVGNHIVFARGRFAPNTAMGRRLLAHELVHVVQQDGGSPRPLLQRDPDGMETPTTTDAAPESLSDRLYRRAVQEAAEQVAHSMSRALPIPIPESVLAALLAAEVSFLHRSYQRLVERGDGLRIVGRVRELLNPLTAVEFAGRFLWGVLKGLVSPITGLVQLAVAGIRLQLAANQWLYSLPARAPELVAEAIAVQHDLERFSTTASATLRTLRERDQLLAFAGAIFSAASSASDAFEHQLVRAAQRQGTSAADSLVEHFLVTPLPELAETAGEIVGTVVIELVLLLFTDGIGNLITKVGEFVRALRPLSRGAVAFIEVAMAVGRVISQIEHIVGVLLSRTVLRPFMPLFEALEPLLGRMRGFAQRLVGMSEESTLALARAGTGALEEGAAATTRSAERTVLPEVHPPATPRRPPPSAADPVLTDPSAPVTTPMPATPEVAPIDSTIPRVAETPVVPPPATPVATPTPVRSRPPTRGATAENLDARFRYEYHPEPSAPIVERRRGASSPEVPAVEPSVSPRAARRSTPPTSDAAPPIQSSSSSDIPDDLAELDEFSDVTGGTGRGGSSADPDVLNLANPQQAKEIAGDIAGGRLSTRQVWERPPDAPPAPSLDAPAQERIEWLRERLQLHVDQAVERYRIEGLTTGQEAALVDAPRMGPAFRGSRIDEFAKASILQDPELAEVITAPDFINEPDILDSVFPTWFDMTTQAQWAAHIRTYGARYGASLGHHLPTH